MMNNSIFIAALFAAAMLTVAAPMAHAQNATSTGTGQQQQQTFRHGFGGHERGFERGGFLGLGLGARAHVGLPLVGTQGGSAVIVSGAGATPTPTPIREHDNHQFNHGFFGGHDFAREGLFARAHHEHFIFLNNRYVYLPEQVQCPGGSVLVGDQCVVQSQILVQQEAPTILAEQAPQIEGQAVPEVTGSSDQNSAITTTQTQEVAPNVSCPAGSVLVGNECQSTTVQNSAPIITCPADTQLQGSTCIQQAQNIVVQQSCGCPEGSTASGTQCIVSALPSAVIQGSAPDEIIISGHHFHHLGELPFLRR